MQLQATEQTPPISLQALELLNESANDVYALTYNPRNSKWVVVQLARVRGLTALLDEGAIQPATFRVVSFTAGNTPNEAARDALRLQQQPERTVPSPY